ncbi:MAG: glutaredoxin family protein [Actinomycetota bacterium]|nr:glutaredoxin family protein [Actinomycetota bacterium]
MSDEITVYTSQSCGPCRRLKRHLGEAGVSFREVDIDREPGVARRIEQSTGGFRIVPTVEIGGRLLVNPLPAEVVALAADN